MARTANNIFSVVKQLRDSADRKILVLDSLQERALSGLERLIMSGAFSKSGVDKFICNNYTLTSKGLTELWNKTHQAGFMRNGKKSTGKKEVTFRVQISQLSSKLYHMLGLDEASLRGLFNGSGIDVKKLELLITLGDVSGHESVDLRGKFSYSLHDYLFGYDYEDEYTLDECREEMELIKAFDMANLQRLFGSVDKDKLAYVLACMRAPLFIPEDIFEDCPDRRRALMPVINEYKLDVLARYHHADAAVITSKEDNPWGLDMNDEVLGFAITAKKALGYTLNYKPVNDRRIIDAYKKFLKTKLTSEVRLEKLMRGVNNKGGILEFGMVLKELEMEHAAGTQSGEP